MISCCARKFVGNVARTVAVTVPVAVSQALPCVIGEKLCMSGKVMFSQCRLCSGLIQMFPNCSTKRFQVNPCSRNRPTVHAKKWSVCPASIGMTGKTTGIAGKAIYQMDTKISQQCRSLMFMCLRENQASTYNIPYLSAREFSTKQNSSKLNIRNTKEKVKEAKESFEETVKELREDVVVTVPNMLTGLRICLTPVLGYLVLHEVYALACGVFVIAGITDVLDGWIARNFDGQESAFGSFLDPLADKFLISVVFITLTMVDLIPVPLTALIIYRDVCLIVAAFYIRYISLAPPVTLTRFFDITNATATLQPTWPSKLNTALQLFLVAASLGAPVFDFVNHPALQVLWYTTAATTLGSGIGYIFAKDTFKILKKSRANTKS